MNVAGKIKVRTLTLVEPCNDNYGAYLQGWALCKALNKIPVIDAKCLRYYEHDLVTARKTLSLIDNIKNRIVSRQLKDIGSILIGALKELVKYTIVLLTANYSLEKKQRLLRFEQFGSSFQDIKSPICWNYKMLDEADADVFVVGSDWVWSINLDVPRKGFFGDIKTNKKFFSYAASFGVNPNSEEKIKFIDRFAKNFVNISVREREAMQLFLDLGYKNVHNDVDPTLLLSAEDWLEVSVEPKNKYNLVVYWLPNEDEEKFLAYISAYRQKHPEATVVVVNPNPLKVPGAECKWNIGPQDFIGYIKSADFVITNSFHACVFSILFKIPFSVFPRYFGDTRIQNLLRLTGLENRMVMNCNSIVDDEMIDWKKAHEQIKCQSEKSFKYLMEILLKK